MAERNGRENYNAYPCFTSMIEAGVCSEEPHELMVVRK